MKNAIKRVGVGVTATFALIATPLMAVADEGAQADNLVTLDLYNLTDIHGHIEQVVDSKTGKVKEAGLAAMNCYISKERKEKPDTTQFTLLGDNIGASPFTSGSQLDNPTIEALNAMDPLASTVGNHEFDDGVDVFRYRVEGGSDKYVQANFPFLAANMSGAAVDFIGDWVMWEVPNHDLKVAFIGALEEDAPSKVAPGTFDGIDFDHAWESINTKAKELKEDEGADIVIAMYDHDAMQGAQRMDPAYVDGLMGGDTHSVYQLTAEQTGTVAAIASGSYTDNLANLKVTYDTAKGDVVKVEPEIIPADEIAKCDTPNEVTEIVANAVAVAEKDKNTEVASNIGEFRRGTHNKTDDYGSNRGIESTLGDLIANSMRDMVITNVTENKHADIGMINAGGIRADLIPNNGVVTRGDVFAVMPFSNEIGYVELTGADVKQLLEEQWKQIGEGSSRPMLKLGLSDNVQYTYDPTREFGDRITSVLVDGEPLDPEKTYEIGSVTFLLAGGDSFDAFKNAKDGVKSSGALDRDAFEKYLKAQGEAGSVQPNDKKQSVGVSVTSEGTDAVINLRGLSFSEGPGIAQKVKVTAGDKEAVADVNNDLTDEKFNTMDAIITTDGAGQASVKVDVSDVCTDASEPTVKLPLTVATNVKGEEFVKVVDEKQGLTVDVACSVEGPTVYRKAGHDRYQTAVEIAQELAPADTVYLATGETYPDALTAAAVAGHQDAPVLLVQPNKLTADVADGISALSPKNIVIVGGKGAISANVETKVKALDKSAKVTRIGGKDRFDTAAKLADSAYDTAETVYLANGLDFPDALSASAAGAYNDGPVLLVTAKKVPTATANAIKELKPTKIVVVGGEGVVSKAVISDAKALSGAEPTVYAGKNRFDTAAKVGVGEFPDTVPFAAIADGTKFPDALTAAAVAGSKGGPILLTMPKSLPAETKGALTDLAPAKVMIAGGTGAVSQAVSETIQLLLK